MDCEIYCMAEETWGNWQRDLQIITEQVTALSLDWTRREESYLYLLGISLNLYVFIWTKYHMNMLAPYLHNHVSTYHCHQLPGHEYYRLGYHFLFPYKF
jgi:hypothetical protein